VAGGITVPSSADGNEFKITRLRAKFAMSVPRRPASVAESDWDIFTACVHQKRPLTSVSRSVGVSPSSLRDTLARVEALMDPPALTPERPLEDLQLSVRARNALHRLDCKTVGDVFRLDFNGALRQLGSKTRLEVLSKLEEFGFRLAIPNQTKQMEMRRIARNLDRVQSRINTTIESVMRKIRTLQDRLKKLGG
jgi:hypothetical protein